MVEHIIVGLKEYKSEMHYENVDVALYFVRERMAQPV